MTMTLNEYIVKMTALLTRQVELLEEDIKNSWDYVAGECKRAHPDVRVLYSEAKRIEGFKSQIESAESQMGTMRSVLTVIENNKEV